MAASKVDFMSSTVHTMATSTDRNVIQEAIIESDLAKLYEVVHYLNAVKKPLQTVRPDCCNLTMKIDQGQCQRHKSNQQNKLLATFMLVFQVGALFHC